MYILTLINESQSYAESKIKGMDLVIWSIWRGYIAGMANLFQLVCQLKSGLLFSILSIFVKFLFFQHQKHVCQVRIQNHLKTIPIYTKNKYSSY
jgi:hypothetical protein